MNNSLRFSASLRPFTLQLTDSPALMWRESFPQAESNFPSIESQSANRSYIGYPCDVIRLGGKKYFSSFAGANKCCYVSQSENQLGDSQCAEVCFCNVLVKYDNAMRFEKPQHTFSHWHLTYQGTRSYFPILIWQEIINEIFVKI